ncbi:MAG: phage holin family protein [Planctomycetota bacterium]
MATDALELEPRAPELSSAVTRAAGAAEHLLADRLDLARLEAEASLSRAARRAAWVGVGAGLLLAGWALLLVACVLALRGLGLSSAAGLTVVGLPHALLGAGLLLWGGRAPEAEP